MHHSESPESGDDMFVIALPLANLGGLGIRPQGNKQALTLVESTRKQMLRAYRTVVHESNADSTVLFQPVTTWDQVPDLLAHGLVDVLAYNASETCRYAPFAAAAVSAWRAVLVLALCFRDGEIPFATLAWRAALTAQLCEWISGGGVAAALDPR
jgi:hypothetical protein